MWDHQEGIIIIIVLISHSHFPRDKSCVQMSSHPSLNFLRPTQNCCEDGLVQVALETVQEQNPHAKINIYVFKLKDK